MPIYLVERTFSFENGLGIPEPEDDLKSHLAFDANNTQAGVSWIHSFITPDKKKAFCLYRAPNPETLRHAARLNRLPVDRINEVHIQAPFAITPLQSAVPLHEIGSDQML